MKKQKYGKATLLFLLVLSLILASWRIAATKEQMRIVRSSIFSDLLDNFTKFYQRFQTEASFLALEYVDTANLLAKQAVKNPNQKFFTNALEKYDFLIGIGIYNPKGQGTICLRSSGSKPQFGPLSSEQISYYNIDDPDFRGQKLMFSNNRFVKGINEISNTLLIRLPHGKTLFLIIENRSLEAFVSSLNFGGQSTAEIMEMEKLRRTTPPGLTKRQKKAFTAQLRKECTFLDSEKQTNQLCGFISGDYAYFFLQLGTSKYGMRYAVYLPDAFPFLPKWQKNYIWASITSYLALIFFSALICRVYRRTRRSLWQFSTLFSILTTALALYWVSLLPPVNTNPGVNLTLQDLIIRTRLGKSNEGMGLTPVPTQIYIENIDFKQSREVGVSGYITQTLPSDKEFHTDMPILLGKTVPGEPHEVKLYRKKSIGNQTFYTWKFFATIKQSHAGQFRSFNLLHLQIPLINNTNPEDGYIFIPQKDGLAEALNLDLPGIDTSDQKGLKIPGWHLKHTSYSYLETSIDQKDRFTTTSNTSELIFTLQLSQKIFGSIYTSLIPLALYALILFTTLYLQKIRSNRDLFSGIGALIGLLVILSFKKNSGSNAFLSESIAFINGLTLTLYFLLICTLIGFVLATFQKEKSPIDQELFRLPKMLFWPIFSAMTMLLVLKGIG